MPPTSTRQDARSRRPAVKVVDFRRPAKFSREHLRQMEHAHASFCQEVSRRMSADLRTEFDLVWMNTDQLPYSIVMNEEIPKTNIAAILALEPQDGEILLTMESGIAGGCVHRLLGGKGDGPDRSDGGLTDLEANVFKRILETMVQSLSRVWQEAAGATLRLESVETGTAGVQIAPPSEPALIISLAATLDGNDSIMNLVLPYRSVASVLHRFDSGKYGVSAARPDEASVAMMGASLAGVPLQVDVEAGHSSMTLRRLLELTPGDVLRFRRPTDEGVVVRVGGVVGWSGHLVRHEGHRAVQVVRRVRENTT